MYTNKPNRLPGFDYSSDRFYFVTSVVKNRTACFGDLEKGTMKLNQFGEITTQQMRWLSEQYPYVLLHEFVIMPDHIHALIEIDPTRFNGKIKSLSELMGAFKTRSSKFIRLAGLVDFQWQTSFHDRIVRKIEEIDRISKYIRDNPKNG